MQPIHIRTYIPTKVPTHTYSQSSGSSYQSLPGRRYSLALHTLDKPSGGEYTSLVYHYYYHNHQTDGETSPVQSNIPIE